MKKNKNEKTSLTQVKAYFEEVAPRVSVLTFGEGEKKFTVNVYPVISFEDRMKMVDEIVDGVFMGEQDSVNCYMPESLEFLKRSATIKYFTDLPLPKKIGDAWMVLSYTPIYDDVVKIVEKELSSIFEAVYSAIDTKRRYLASKTDFNMLLGKLGATLGNINESLPKEELQGVLGKLKDIPEGANAQDILTTLFGKQGLSG